MTIDERRARDAARKRANYAKNREAEKERARRWKAQNREAMREYTKAWKLANPERAKGHRSRNSERAREYAKEYQRTPAGRAANAVHQHRRRHAMLEGDMTAGDWLERLDEFNYRCGYCLKRSDDLQIEHMDPISRGGRHDKANVIPACADCNRRKNARNLLEALAVL